MNSLLTQALVVAEAARALAPTESANVKGMYRLGCEPRDTPSLLRDLALALRDFDLASRVGRDPARVLALAVRYAGEHGVDVRRMAEFVRQGLPGPGGPDAGLASPDPEFVPLPGEIGPPPRIEEESVDQAVIRTRTGGIEVAPKYAGDLGILPGKGVQLTAGGASLRAAATSLRTGERDPGGGAPHRAASPEPAHGRSRDPASAGRGVALAAEFRALSARVGALIERYGNNVQLERLRENIADIGDVILAAGSDVDVAERVGMDVIVKVMKVANEVAAMEQEAEAPEPPRFR